MSSNRPVLISLLTHHFKNPEIRKKTIADCHKELDKGNAARMFDHCPLEFLLPKDQITRLLQTYIDNILLINPNQKLTEDHQITQLRTRKEFIKWTKSLILFGCEQLFDNKGMAHPNLINILELHKFMDIIVKIDLLSAYVKGMIHSIHIAAFQYLSDKDRDAYHAAGNYISANFAKWTREVTDMLYCNKISPDKEEDGIDWTDPNEILHFPGDHPGITAGIIATGFSFVAATAFALLFKPGKNNQTEKTTKPEATHDRVIKNRSC